MHSPTSSIMLKSFTQYLARVSNACLAPRVCSPLKPVQSQYGPLLRGNRTASNFSNVSTSFRKVENDLQNSKGEIDSGYTTAFALFEALWELGVTTCFVNVGADHPSIIEAIAKGKRERVGRWPRTVTCPSEMIAISMADGHARITGRPQAVIVHVDVGTQALAHGIHNASVGRAPVFIFAGLCPFTESGELLGSRTEYMHWLQDPPDQKAIVRQYCRHVGEIRSGLNVKQSVARGLQFASSDPKGPVYLCAARETLAETVPPYNLDPSQWTPIGPGALPSDAVEVIANALAQAQRPLVITGYSGRDRRCPQELIKLADRIRGLRVHDTGGSDMSFPFDHPASQGFRLGYDECIHDADVILLANIDVPWVPSRSPPSKDAKIYHVDIDPLNQHIPVSFFPAHGRWRADCYTALTQINTYLNSLPQVERTTQNPEFDSQRDRLVNAHNDRVQTITKLVNLNSNDRITPHNAGALLKQCLPPDTTYVVEAVTNSTNVYDQLQPCVPGSWINCGATGIGWSNGAALGVRMAIDEEATLHKSSPSEYLDAKRIVCQIIGDGSYMCASPASAAWVAAKYQIPILTVVLNNGGWKAPRASTELVYPTGLNRSASDEDLNLSFEPSPDYAQLAEAAAGSGPDGGKPWVKGIRVADVASMKTALEEATQIISQRQGGVLLEVLMDKKQ